jgi:UDP-3-O-[3-hydroxymyristoyl] glucosamine N-acyltransferase
MLLSALKKTGMLEVVRDAAFENLGFVSDPQPKMLTFFESARHEGLLKSLQGVSCVITKKELAAALKDVKGLAVAGDPRLAFYRIHNHLAQQGFYWEDFPTRISKSAKVHPRAWIAERNVVIGSGAVIEANAVIAERCVLGRQVHVMTGAVLGSIGLQVSRFPEGVVDMAHAGSIEVGDNVQIMAGAVIAGAVFRQSTVIGKGSRIGNLAFVSHNARLGPRCFVGHGSIVNGNVQVGRDVWIGPGAVLTNNITIGDEARIALGSTVIRNVGAGKRMIGYFATEKQAPSGK